MEQAATAGERQYAEYGLTGVRGEAAAGFPSVRNIALPALKAALREGKSLNDAGLSALLRLMAEVDDSNVLKRGGMDGQAFVRACAKNTEPDHDKLRAMNDDFVRRNLSPGGCADLLAAAYFVQLLEEAENNCRRS